MSQSYNDLLLLWLRTLDPSYTQPLAFPAAGTRAQLVGVAGPYAPIAGDTLLLRFNAADEDLVIRFNVGDTTAIAVANRINALAVGGFADLDGAGALRLNSILRGLPSRVAVTGGTLAAALGFAGPFPMIAQGAGDPTGFDLYSSQMAIFATIAEAAERTTESLYIRRWSGRLRAPSSGGVAATATLRLTRTGVADSVLVPTGTVFDALDGTRFATTADVTFGIGVAGPLDVAAAATRVGWSGNLPAGFVSQVPALSFGAQNGGGSVDAASRLLRDSGVAPVLLASHVGLHVRFVGGANAGTLARLVGFVGGPPNAVRLADGPALVAETDTAAWQIVDFADLTFAVTNPTPTANGRDATLDALGAERGVNRREGEVDDPSYRERVANLPDTISPNAVLRAANRILAPFGRRARLREVGVRPDFPGFFADVDAADYAPTLLRVPLDTIEARGFFLVGLPRLNLGDLGAAFDDDAADDGAGDGFDPLAAAAYRAIFSAVDAARAGGVGFQLVIEEDL